MGGAWAGGPSRASHPPRSPPTVRAVVWYLSSGVVASFNYILLGSVIDLTSRSVVGHAWMPHGPRPWERARGAHGGAAATLPARVQTRSCAIRLVMQPAEVL